jgi:hypothetical protein
MTVFFAETEFVISSLEHRKQPERIRRKSSTSGKLVASGVSCCVKFCDLRVSTEHEMPFVSGETEP